VFINSNGLPTYEAKDLGLAYTKFEQYPNLNESVIVTADEQKGYFQVLLKALEQIQAEYADKTRHISHGMLETPEGKMSSRKGNVLGGGTLVEEAEARSREKIKESERDIENPEQLATDEAVAAVKYAILKQAPGKNVVFDMEAELSLEGDSGPYLQYTHTRVVSVLAQGEQRGLFPGTDTPPADPYELERLLYRFPEVVAEAFDNTAPQQLVTYLTDIASRFNTLYGQETILDENDEYTPYKLALTDAVRVVLRNGLSILGIRAPHKM
jgi:arginyl-tRNA synthetase